MVCDTLIGATPGLYGLCVAYCEAHDADLLSELDVPNRRILENYNQKKTESDPPMPCVQSDPDEPPVICPCWSADELLEVLPPTENIDLNFANACDSSDTYGALANYENGENVVPWILLEVNTSSTYEGHCLVDNMGYSGGPSSFYESIFVEVFESCRALLAARANAAKSDGVWDCF